MKTLNENLQQLMREQDISDAELARQTGISQPRITNIRNGKVKNPSITTLKQIAHHFDLTISQLVGETSSQSVHHQVPLLINYEQICLFKVQHNHFCSSIPIYRPLPTPAFAFRHSGRAMEPLFPDQTILIFSSNEQSVDGDYILVHLAGGELVFRQLLKEANKNYLCPLNPKIPTSLQLGQKDEIVGVLKETHFCF